MTIAFFGPLPAARSALSRIVTAGEEVIRLAERWLVPLLQLALRLWIARIFFSSGLTKIHDWAATLFLFEYEYQVPILPVGLAAVLGTAVELAMPVLLVVGLMSRLSTLPLLVLTMVIQFVVGAANPAYANLEHFYWMALLLVIVLHGPGRISLDHLIERHLIRPFATR